MSKNHDFKNFSTRQIPAGHSVTPSKEHTRLLTNQEIIDSYDYLAGAASSSDCTGLIPSAPLNDAELDSYEELYPFLPPVPHSTHSDSSNDNPASTGQDYHPDSVH